MPYFAPTYAAYGVATFFWVFSLASIDAFLMAFCIAINGCFNDLIDMFADIDINLEKYKYRYVSYNLFYIHPFNTSTSFARFKVSSEGDNRMFSEMREDILRCIQYHNEIFG